MSILGYRVRCVTTLGSHARFLLTERALMDERSHVYVPILPLSPLATRSLACLVDPPVCPTTTSWTAAMLSHASVVSCLAAPQAANETNLFLAVISWPP
jgi:hypothetical protein